VSPPFFHILRRAVSLAFNFLLHAPFGVALAVGVGVVARVGAHARGQDEHHQAEEDGEHKAAPVLGKQKPVGALANGIVDEDNLVRALVRQQQLTALVRVGALVLPCAVAAVSSFARPLLGERGADLRGHGAAARAERHLAHLRKLKGSKRHAHTS